MAVGTPDWRDASAYDRLLPGDRRCFAWEWLRRADVYQEGWQRRDAPQPFGLVRLEDPALDAILARPIWSTDVDTAVVRATVRSSEHLAHLFPDALMPLMTTAASPTGVVPVLFSDSLRSIRVDLHVDDAVPAAARIAWHIDGIADIEPQLTALAQFTALYRLGRFSRALHPPERRAARWIATLRVHDALRVGATSREIVAELFRVPTVDARWRTTAAPWRLRVQRLTQAARKYATLKAAAWLDWSSSM